MSPEERDPGLLYDIVLAAQKALRYTDTLSAEQFLADELTQDAVLRHVTIIGEAANRISGSTRAAIDLPWKRIVGQRQVVVHDYGRIDMALIWATVRNDLPPLVAAIEQHLSAL
jgi:uncharacterized protein with HEPN domain